MIEFIDLNKGDKVIYLRNFPYKLSNGQEVYKEGEELIVNSKVSVQKKFFRLVEEKKEVKKEKTIDEMNKEELLKFAESKNLDVDARKGEKKLREEIKSLLDK